MSRGADAPASLPTASVPAGAPAATARLRPAWHDATVAEVRPETPSARRIVLDVPTWPGNEAGQHLDLRLTAEDGYQATRSYSIASAGPGARVELAVDRVADGEVSPFLVDEVLAGDRFEVHGPLGGWFVWRPPAPGDAHPTPVQLIAGGSGVVPLLAMVRAHAAAGDPTPFRLLASVRTPEDEFFRAELAEAVAATAPLVVDVVHTRRAPVGSTEHPGRLTRARLEALVHPPSSAPRVFVCGSTPFVEQVITWLGELGHDTRSVRAERFGGR